MLTRAISVAPVGTIERDTPLNADRSFSDPLVTYASLANALTLSIFPRQKSGD
jgi:hypothetical protein